tara:strand:- start:1134 stop:1490 length:357 start_codon:yes stop_codon:yes gene_type:complete
MEQLISTQIKIYEPQFNTDTDQYYDKSPFKKYERGITHKCPCKIGKLFSNLTQYNQHIKTKTHQNYIMNYKNHNQELDSLKEEIKGLIKEKEFLTRLNLKLQKKIDELENEEFHDVQS